MKMKSTITMMTVSGLALMLSYAPLFAAAGTAQERGQLSEKDYKFVEDAIRGGMLEVQLGELAHTKGVNQSVRTFGEKMVTDHSKANDELKQIIARKGATLPATLSHHENSELEKFQKATGKDFDEDYAEHMIKYHKTDVKDFQDASKDLTDPDLRAFVQKTLPVLEDHLRMAKDMQAAVKHSS